MMKGDNVNLSTMSFAELHVLKQNLEQEIAGRQKEEKANAKKKILEIARLHGLNLEELAGGRKERAPVAAKYANPADKSQTWTGRGRQPVWVVQLLAKGKKLSDFSI